LNNKLITQQSVSVIDNRAKYLTIIEHY